VPPTASRPDFACLLSQVFLSACSFQQRRSALHSCRHCRLVLHTLFAARGSSFHVCLPDFTSFCWLKVNFLHFSQMSACSRLNRRNKFCFATSSSSYRRRLFVLPPRRCRRSGEQTGPLIFTRKCHAEMPHLFEPFYASSATPPEFRGSASFVLRHPVIATFHVYGFTTPDALFAAGVAATPSQSRADYHDYSRHDDAADDAHACRRLLSPTRHHRCFISRCTARHGCCLMLRLRCITHARHMMLRARCTLAAARAPADIYAFIAMQKTDESAAADADVARCLYALRASGRRAARRCHYARAQKAPHCAIRRMPQESATPAPFTRRHVTPPCRACCLLSCRLLRRRCHISSC